MLADQHPELQLLHHLRSPLTNIELAIGLLRRKLAESDSPQIAQLLQSVENDARRLTAAIRVLERHIEHNGETLIIELPVGDIDQLQLPEQPTIERFLLVQEQHTPSQEQATVLLIEDSPTFRAVLGALLRHAGFEVLEADEALPGLDLARQAKPDLIVLDLILPLLDGQQLASVLREDPETKRIPLLICTALDQDQITAIDPHLRVIHKSQNLHEIPTIIAELIAEHRKPPQNTVLVIDDDNSMRPLLARTLEDAGFTVLEAANGSDGLRIAHSRTLDMIVLDLLLPDMDGFDVLVRLRRTSKTLLTPLILLSGIDALTEKVNGLQLGADDYVTKPFMPEELLARINAVLRRHQLEGDASPSTMLPGNVAIDRVISARIASGEPFAVGYLDLDNFKAYNDTYGFLKGDSLIRQIARIVTSTVERHGSPEDFVGHIGGDDFIFITDPDNAAAICEGIIQEFDTLAPLYYDAEARSRGYIEQFDRQGQLRQFPVVTVSIGVVTNVLRPIRHPAEVSDIAAELKKYTKQHAGSTYMIDRRV